MKITATANSCSKFNSHPGEIARVKIILLILVSFCLGLAASVLWLHKPAKPATLGQQATLSESTISALAALDSPVTIRYFSILNDPGVSDSTRSFAGRVDQLLSDYERESNGKIIVTRLISDSDNKAASADGIAAFNMDKGEPCYLGIAVAQADRKETLSRLVEDWEPALESDVTRSITRVAQPKRASSAMSPTAPPDRVASEEVRRALPDVTTVSVEEGTRRLQEAALKEFKETAATMDAQVKAAEQQYQKVLQSGGSAAQLETAIQELQRAQSEQTEKLKQIAAKAQAQISAFEQMKKSAP